MTLSVLPCSLCVDSLLLFCNNTHKMRRFLSFLSSILKLSSSLLLAHQVKAQEEIFGPYALSYLGAKQTCIESTGSSLTKRCFYTYIPDCAGPNSPLVFDIHGYVYVQYDIYLYLMMEHMFICKSLKIHSFVFLYIQHSFFLFLACKKDMALLRSLVPYIQDGYPKQMRIALLL